jgi:hypothetical protein
VPHTLPRTGILRKLWGSQSWLQPAFSRLLTDVRTRPWPEGPPKKSAAGKIARPTTNAEMSWMGKACGIEHECSRHIGRPLTSLSASEVCV